MVDPLAEIRAAAQQGIAAQRAARPSAPGNVLPSSLPGQPGYASRIPPPDGPAMGEVDQVGVSLPTAPVVREAPYPAGGMPATGAPPSPRRVVVYCGRGDDFVVSVEESAEDEALYSKKYDLGTLLPILDVVRALGVKVIDRTGGELHANEITLRSGREQGSTRVTAIREGSEGERSDWQAVPLYPSAEPTG